MADFLMPSLGADMQEGKLVAWRRRPGESVARGDIIAEVETEKGVIEVECFTPGVVESLCAQPGEKLTVGSKLATIRAADLAPKAMTKAEPRMPSPVAAVPAVPTPTRAEAPQVAEPALHASPSVRRLLREHAIEPSAVRGTGRAGTVTHDDALAATNGRRTMLRAAPETGERVRISPLALRLARERGLELTSLTRSGPGGYVVAQDVLRAPVAREPAKAAAPQDGMRAAIAQAMSRSKREIPHYYLSHTVDLGNVMAFLDRENARRKVPDRLLLGVLFVQAVARALRKLPELNGHYVDGRYVPARQINIGVAVSLRTGGLIAPAIMDADKLSLDELSSAFKDVVTRARGGHLRSSEMSEATITITSLGERGVETVFPIIVPPQVAMVGFGMVVEKPMVVDGAVMARPTVTVTLAADHRVSDGHRGGLFLSAVQAALQELAS